MSDATTVPIDEERPSDDLSNHVTYWFLVQVSVSRISNRAFLMDPHILENLRDFCRSIPSLTVHQLQEEFQAHLDQTFPLWSISGNVLAAFNNVPYAEIASAEVLKAFNDTHAILSAPFPRAVCVLTAPAERLVWSVHYSRLLSLDAGVGYRYIGRIMKRVGDAWPNIRRILMEYLTSVWASGILRAGIEPGTEENYLGFWEMIQEVLSKVLPETWSIEEVAGVIERSFLSRAKLPPHRVQLLFPGRTEVPPLIGVKFTERRQGARQATDRIPKGSELTDDQLDLHGKAWAPIYRRLLSFGLLWFAAEFEGQVVAPSADTSGQDSVRLHGRPGGVPTPNPTSRSRGARPANTKEAKSTTDKKSERFAFRDTKTRAEQLKRSSKRRREESAESLEVLGAKEVNRGPPLEFIRATGTSKGLFPLPYEVQHEILTYLPPRHLNCAVICCRPWFHLVRSDPVMRGSVQRSRVLKAAYNQFFEDDWGEKAQILLPPSTEGFLANFLSFCRWLKQADSPPFDFQHPAAVLCFSFSLLFPTEDMMHLFAARAAHSHPGGQGRGLAAPDPGQRSQPHIPLPHIFSVFQR